MKSAISLILGLWLLEILLLTACRQAQTGLNAATTKVAGDASATQTEQAPTNTPTAIPTRKPMLLASGQAHPTSLVVDSQTVYWETDDAIMAYSKDQGTSKTLVSSRPRIYSLKADTDSLFWIEDTLNSQGASIFRLSKSGGQPVRLASFTRSIGGLAVDDTYVYWNWRESSGLDSDEVMRMPKTGGGTPEPAPVPARLFDGPEAYWLNKDGDLFRANKDGSSAIALVKNNDLKKLGRCPTSIVRIRGIFPRPSGIYFGVRVDTLMDAPSGSDCFESATVLMRIPKGSGDYREVARVDCGANVFVTEPFAYFDNDCSPPGIIKVALDTQTVETIVTWTEPSSRLVADDAEYVYWTDYDNGLIEKVVK